MKTESLPRLPVNILYSFLHFLVSSSSVEMESSRLGVAAKDWIQMRGATL
jgi:hypothetical protein